MRTVSEIGERTKGGYRVGTLLVVALFMISALIRLPEMREGVGARNLEASYHVLLTMEAMDRSAAREHLWLPTVSLGAPMDKGIIWGATVRMKSGHQIYTSYFPAGFLLPYGALKALGAEFSLQNLVYFNMTLGLAGAVLFFLLAAQIAEVIAPGRRKNNLDAVLATTPLIFSREALSSTGLIYWHQNVYQVILILVCICLLSILRNTKPSSFAVLALPLLALLGGLLDWTAYLVNGALVLVLGIAYFSERPRYLLAGGVVVATALAGFSVLLHFSSGVGVDTYLASLTGRFLPRSVSSEPMTMPIGYVLSFGSFLFVFVIAMWFIIGRYKSDRNLLAYRPLLAIGLVLATACMENLILYQHASQFTFDRFKSAIAIGFVTIIALATVKVGVRRGLSALIVASCLIGYVAFKVDLQHFSRWHEVNTRNLALRDRIDSLVDRSCTVFGTNYHVRGYTNLLLMRGVHEEIDEASFKAIAKSWQGCGAVYLRSKPFKSDLFEFTEAVIHFPSGATQRIEP